MKFRIIMTVILLLVLIAVAVVTAPSNEAQVTAEDPSGYVDPNEDAAMKSLTLE